MAAQVKARARELGFDLCGIARAHPIEAERLDHWLANGWDAGLAYVRERRAERLDPALGLPGARCGIALAASYAPGPDDPGAEGEAQIAGSARGRDQQKGLPKPAARLAAWLRRGA